MELGLESVQESQSEVQEELEEACELLSISASSLSLALLHSCHSGGLERVSGGSRFFSSSVGRGTWIFWAGRLALNFGLDFNRV